jgi:hypothetical protein
VTAQIASSSGEELSIKGTNFCATANAEESGRFGAMTMAGSGARAVQQFAPTDLTGSDGEAQQLCAALWVCPRQIPNGTSSAPIDMMATAAR